MTYVYTRLLNNAKIVKCWMMIHTTLYDWLLLFRDAVMINRETGQTCIISVLTPYPYHSAWCGQHESYMSVWRMVYVHSIASHMELVVSLVTIRYTLSASIHVSGNRQIVIHPNTFLVFRTQAPIKQTFTYS